MTGERLGAAVRGLLVLTLAVASNTGCRSQNTTWMGTPQAPIGTSTPAASGTPGGPAGTGAGGLGGLPLGGAGGMPGPGGIGGGGLGGLAGAGLPPIPVGGMLGPEVCDGKDNNGNGIIDGVLTTLCTICRPNCILRPSPGPLGWQPTPQNSSSVVVDQGGALTLTRQQMEAHAVWVANTGEGTVSKLHSRTNVELARYPTVLAGVGRTWSTPCDATPQGNCPSRTAVDQQYNAYVANRAFNGQGSVTKYANKEQDCVDRNLNGMIDTSRDIDQNGEIDINNPQEFVGLADECILWSKPVGPNNGVPRALAIGLNPLDPMMGTVWVGLFAAGQACQLDPHTGDTIACVDVPGYKPYGAIGDAQGRIWIVSRSALASPLGYVDQQTLQWHPAPEWPPGGSSQAYGITLDEQGRVYVAEADLDTAVHRYNPTNRRWATARVPAGGTLRGVAAGPQHLWAAVSHNSTRFAGGPAGRIEQLSLANFQHVASHNIPSGLRPVGVGVGFDGAIWAICRENQIAARLEPAAGTWIEHRVGADPYTYSDFIGYGVNILITPKGHYRFAKLACEGKGAVRWEGIDARMEVPPGTHVEYWVRTAITPQQLPAAPWIGPFIGAPGQPINLKQPPGPLPPLHNLELEVRLSTNDNKQAPRVLTIDLVHDCEMEIK